LSLNNFSAFRITSPGNAELQLGIGRASSFSAELELGAPRVGLLRKMVFAQKVLYFPV
jgi:hypothetical protein